MDNVNEPLLAQGAAPASTAPPSASAAPAPEQKYVAAQQAPYLPGPYQPGLYQPGPYQPGGPGPYQPGGPGPYQPGPYQQQQPFQQQAPYQQQPFQQQPYQQQAPYQQQQPYQQQTPYQQQQPYGSASYVPSTAYGGGGAGVVPTSYTPGPTPYNNNASSVGLNVGSQVVGSAAPLPLAAAQVSVESLYREYERVRTAVLILTLMQCVLWFPLGMLFLECYDEVGRGRRHWTMGAFFFALSLVTCATLTAFFYVVGIFLLPHIIVSAVCMAKGKEMDYLEKALRLVDYQGFLMRYSPARTQTIVVAN